MGISSLFGLFVGNDPIHLWMAVWTTVPVCFTSPFGPDWSQPNFTSQYCQEQPSKGEKISRVLAPWKGGASIMAGPCLAETLAVGTGG